MISKMRHAPLALVALLAGCGGSSSSPTPSVSPPTQTPTPTPPPGPTISVVGGSTTIANIFFFPPGQGYDGLSSAVPTSVRGYYPAIDTFLGAATSGTIPTNYADLKKVASTIDSAANVGAVFRAPEASRVISPISHMLSQSPDQAKLKSQLGLSNGPYALQVDRDLFTFDPVAAIGSGDPVARADGERILAQHVRLMALACGIGILRGGNSPEPMRDCDYSRVARYLGQSGASYVFTEANLALFYRNWIYDTATQMPAERVERAAHVLRLYLELIPERLATRAQSAQLQIGIFGYLFHKLDAIGVGNSTDALSLTSSDVANAIARYSETLTYGQNARTYPFPDFYRLARGETFTADKVVTYKRAFTEEVNRARLFAYNDLYSDRVFTDSLATIAAVEVPSQNSSEISAVLNPDGSVTMKAGSNFSGVTYFDYISRHPETGALARGRVYVTIQ
ncbi:MAG: hypothetical protein J7485_05590 [Sphingobium sp.]|nr:hypothetical protein [Sphingobium sp.]